MTGAVKTRNPLLGFREAVSLQASASDCQEVGSPPGGVTEEAQTKVFLTRSMIDAWPGEPVAQDPRGRLVTAHVTKARAQ